MTLTLVQTSLACTGQAWQLRPSHFSSGAFRWVIRFNQSEAAESAKIYTSGKFKRGKKPDLFFTGPVKSCKEYVMIKQDQQQQ